MTYLIETPVTVPETDTTTTDTIPRFIVASDEEFEKPYRVIIENDDVTPMEFVVAVLSLFFGLDVAHAERVMLEAHYEGHAYVATYPFAEAQERVYAAHSAAREAGYPLTFYLEPDD
jgi:ATP-dependent Clp protease adaptor protein ClpS